MTKWYYNINYQLSPTCTFYYRRRQIWPSQHHWDPSSKSIENKNINISTIYHRSCLDNQKETNLFFHLITLWVSHNEYLNKEVDSIYIAIARWTVLTVYEDLDKESHYLKWKMLRIMTFLWQTIPHW